jgi:ketosteroid isomerase-like protein
MSSRVYRLIVFLTLVSSVPFTRPLQGQYGSPPAGQSAPASLRAAVDAANRRFESAFNEGDAAGAAREFYARDARILPPGSATVQGVRQVQLSTRDLQPVGDTAYEIGQATLTLANGRHVMPRYLIVWRKEGGVWRRYLDIWNMEGQ